jgi:hypothetical protein
MMVVGAMPAMLALGAAAPAPALTAKDFESAAIREMPGMRDQVVKPVLAISSSVARNTQASAVAKDFSAPGLGVNSKRPEVRLNAAILIHDLKTLSTDSFLIPMLQNADPAVRYWAAKGLADISPGLVSAGLQAKAQAALGDQSKVETSGVVSQQIIQALIQYKAFGPLLDALNAVTTQMEMTIPDVATLQTAAQGLNFVSGLMAAASPADKIKAATVAARLASFAAQQQKNNETAIKVIDPTATLPPDYVSAVKTSVDASVKVINGAAVKPFPVPTGATAVELLLNVNGLVGKDMQADANLKSVPVPPQVKSAP